MTHYARGRLAAGWYVFRVEACTPTKSSLRDIAGYELRLRLWETDLILHYTLWDTPKARWAWIDLVEKFDDLPLLVGRSFIMEITRERAEFRGRRSPSEYLNRVTQVLAEVLP